MGKKKKKKVSLIVKLYMILTLKDVWLGSFKSLHITHSLILFSVLFLHPFSSCAAFDYGTVAFTFPWCYMVRKQAYLAAWSSLCIKEPHKDFHKESHTADHTSYGPWALKMRHVSHIPREVTAPQQTLALRWPLVALALCSPALGQVFRNL